MRRLMVATSISISLMARGSGAARAKVIDDRRLATSAEIQLSTCSEIIASAACSPTDKAMAFRNRGAARHDEMPQFALRDAQIDTIVAYINGLSSK
jgi:hypothetical protein